MKKTEKAIKELLIENSLPNAERIKSKFNYNTNDNNGKMTAEIIVETRKRNIWLVILACMLIIVSICIALPYLLNNSSSSSNFGIVYFDGTQAEWGFDIGIKDLANDHNVMTFSAYGDEEVLIDVNNCETLQFKYFNIDGNGSIVMNVYLNNRLSDEFRYCLNFKQLLLWNSMTIRYKTSVTNSIVRHTIFFQDSPHKNNYVIKITALENKGIEYYLDKLSY